MENHWHLVLWPREDEDLSTYLGWLTDTHARCWHLAHRTAGSTPEFGFSKDHRPERLQIVVGVVLNGSGRPLCCEVWPGNTTDVKTLIPIVDRLRERFSIRSICVVADRGMISAETIAQLTSPERGMHYILGARLRSVKEIREEVLSHPGRYREVHGSRKKNSDPSPLKVKNVKLHGRRYVSDRKFDSRPPT